MTRLHGGVNSTADKTGEADEINTRRRGGLIPGNRRTRDLCGGKTGPVQRYFALVRDHPVACPYA